MRAFILSIGRSERGATAVEYALILAMIALAIVGALRTLSTSTAGIWTHVAEEVTSHM